MRQKHRQFLGGASVCIFFAGNPHISHCHCLGTSSFGTEPKIFPGLTVILAQVHRIVGGSHQNIVILRMHRQILYFLGLLHQAYLSVHIFLYRQHGQSSSRTNQGKVFQIITSQ